MKLLLVEDNPMNRDMLSRRLARRGFDVVVAVDGREALRKVADEKPDVVLMDLSLPVLSGWEATRRLKAEPETAGIPVIALTAHALSGDYQRAIDAGCDEYETKPVNLDRLIGKIDELRGTSKASSA